MDNNVFMVLLDIFSIPDMDIKAAKLARSKTSYSANDKLRKSIVVIFIET